MAWQPRLDGFNDRVDLLFGPVLRPDEVNSRGIVRRVRLGVTGRRRDNVRRGQRVADIGQRVLIANPIDQMVGEIDNRLLRAPGLRHVHARVTSDEVEQKSRIGGREGLENGLVGVADPHPIAALTHEPGDDLLLNMAGVLGLIFENVGPAMAEALEEIG